MKNNGVGIIMILMTVLMCLTDGNAQEKKVQPLLVGKPMPEFVILPDGKQKKAITNKTLLGKPAIMMFFSTGCVGSFRTLPKVDAVYRQFKNDVNFIIVGKDEDSIRHVYKRFQSLYNLQFPVVFDADVFKAIGLRGVPMLIWLTREGVVQAVTHEIDEREVKKLIDGENFNLPDSSPEGKQTVGSFDYSKALLVESNGSGMEVLQHTLLTRWRIGITRESLGPSMKGEHPMEKLERLQLIDCDLNELYRIAYAGRSTAYLPQDTARYAKWQYLPLLEVADPSPFTDTSFGRNAYCYSQTLPSDKRTPEIMMNVMQRDLKLNFNYEVSIEARKMPYYRLLVVDKSLIKKSAVDRKKSKYHTLLGGRLARTTIMNLISHIDHTTATSWEHNLPIVDETGIDYEIDIRIEGITTSIEEAVRGLRKNGFDLVLGEKSFKVIVIRDSIEKNN